MATEMPSKPGTKAASTPDPRIGAEALASELAEVRALQARLQQQVDESSAAPLLEEQRNLAARLAILLAAQLKTPLAQPVETLPPSTPALGAPPYAAAALDALRDWVDGLQAQRRSLDVAALSLDAQVAGLVNARRKAEEMVRLRQDQIAQSREAMRRERLQAELEVAQLEVRIAAVELARADTARFEARDRSAALLAQLEPAWRELERVRAYQVIDDAALEQISTSSRAARRQFQLDRQRASARLAKAEAAAGGTADANGGAPQVGAALSREIKALRGELAALGELDTIEAGRIEVWRQRRLALGALVDADQREQASALISRSIDQLGSRAQASADRLAQMRAGLRSERLRVEALASDDASLPIMRRALDAQQREADAIEAVQEKLQRLQLLLVRSLEDMGVAVEAAPAPWPQRIWAALQEGSQAIWHYELFSVSESTQVMGRTVTLDYGVTVGKSVGVVLLFFLGWWAASRLSAALIAVIVQRLQLSPQLGRVMQRWMLTLLLLGVLVLVLKLARIPLTAFAVLGGALAIGVGFGTQNIIKNLISGVIILFERKVRVGDIVTIDGVTGTVSSVDLRATTLRGFDGIEAIVPNSQLLENRVSNWSYDGSTVRRAILVGLRYGDDPRAASACLLACANAHPSVLQEPAPEALFDDFASDAQQLRLQYWMQLGGARTGPSVDSDLRYTIAEAFASQGFVIAFPQRDVHLRLDERSASKIRSFANAPFLPIPREAQS
nr:mechanosensitive ion channel domain-containing protein [Roseateles albus]